MRHFKCVSQAIKQQIINLKKNNNSLHNVQMFCVYFSSFIYTRHDK